MAVGLVLLQAGCLSQASAQRTDSPQAEAIEPSEALQPWVNVKEFGAEGTGLADDTRAIQDALNATRAGGSVYFPEGTYRAKELVICRPVTCYGEGTLKYPDDVTVFSLLRVVADQVVLRGLTFDGNRSGQSVWSEFRHSLTVLDCAKVRIEGCTFRDPVGDAVYLGCQPGAAFPFKGVSDVVLTGCRFNGSNQNRNGVSVICGQRISLVDNQFDGMATEKMPGAIDFEPDQPGQFIQNVTVSRNTIRRCRAGIIFANWHRIPFTDFCGFTVIGNTISQTVGSTSDGGIRVWRGAKARIFANHIEGVTNGPAALCEGQQLSFCGNVVEHCQWGVHASAAPGVRLSHNDFSEITGGTVISVACSPHSLVSFNHISGWTSGEYAMSFEGVCEGSVVSQNRFDGIARPIAAIHVSPETKDLIGTDNTYLNCSVHWDRLGTGTVLDALGPDLDLDPRLMIGPAPQPPKP